MTCMCLGFSNPQDLLTLAGFEPENAALRGKEATSEPPSRHYP